MNKPTIAELEAILEEKDVAVEILPNGEAHVVDLRAERIAELEAQLAAANERANNWKQAHERAACIAAEEASRQRAELEAQLAEANADIKRKRELIVEHEKAAVRIMDEYDKAEASWVVRAKAAEADAERLREFAKKLWRWANDRRCRLIKVKRSAFTVSDKFLTELAELQALADENIRVMAPLPIEALERFMRERGIEIPEPEAPEMEKHG